ncbi:MAG TPA: tetrahydrofolate dehydrogenase/cyclohydrolase catalytic domain-containing protein, partial [bacterium]|nr:tetrahydrofolate dehydrogenase/cyclohydrolase catalytic domain-containing protein [bacterium]
MRKGFLGSTFVCFVALIVLVPCLPAPLLADEEPEDVLTQTKVSGQRTWRVPSPLFQELLSENAPQLPGEAGFLWTHPFMADRMRSIGVQFGVEYSLDETGQLMADLNFHPIQESVNMGKVFAEKRYPQAKPLVKLNWYRARGEGMPTVSSDGQTMLFAPKNRQKYLEETEELLKQYGNDIWGVFAGDEMVLKQRKAIFAILESGVEKHPYIKDIEADIRQRFGLGTYGIPSGQDDPEPYKWLAMSLWLDEQVCLLVADLRKIIDRVAPHVVLVGDDPASHAYVRSTVKKCAQHGIAARRSDLPANTSTDTLLALLGELA